MGKWIKKRKFGFGIVVYLSVAVFAMLAFAAYTGNKAVTLGGRATYDIYDEDNMGSNDAFGLVTQQSARAYSDAAGGLTPYLISGITPFSADATGASFLQTENGFMYLIDQTAINQNAMDQGDDDGIEAAGLTIFVVDAAASPGGRFGVMVLTGTSTLNLVGAPNEAEAVAGVTTSKFQPFASFSAGASTVQVSGTNTELEKVGQVLVFNTTYDQCSVVSAYQVGGIQ